jgi:hypothetical protein
LPLVLSVALMVVSLELCWEYLTDISAQLADETMIVDIITLNKATFTFFLILKPSVVHCELL